MTSGSSTVGSARMQAVGLAQVRGRRRPWLIAAGALLACLGALVVVWLVGAAGQRQEVLVLRQDVEYGQVLEAEDLGIARVSVDPGIEVVPASQESLVVGAVATTRLAAGMLLTRGSVEAEGEPSAGRVLVPIALPAERMPAGGLRAGDRILAVSTEESAAARGGTSATVVRVGPMDVNGVTVVDVTTSTPDGPSLAIAAANGQVALVVQPAGR